MPQPNDLSRSLVALEQDITLIAVIEMSQSSWLVAGIVPGIERHPLKKLEPDEAALLRLLWRWRDEAAQKGRTIMRIAVAFEVAVTASGWHVGCGRVASKPMSSIRRALPSRESIGGRRRIGLIPSF